MAPKPTPSWVRVKIPGDVDSTRTDSAALVGPLEPPARTTTLTLVPAGVSNGTCALIWPDETKISGAARPSIVTDVPTISVGRGRETAPPRSDARLSPKMEISDPGATMLFGAATK